MVTQLPEDIEAAKPVYNSEDTAIFINQNPEDKTLELQNMKTGKRYTLNYDGTTAFWDKYEQAISLAQLERGSVVTARFYKEAKKLAYLKENSAYVHYDDLKNYILDTKAKKISISGTEYKLNSHLVILSDEKEAELMDINQMDILSVWAYQDQIYSINVERGHGYLRLKNDTYFIDGWIEVGQSVIQKVTEDMLLVVPEGVETVSISHNGSSATQEITFERNEEMIWDLETVEIVRPQTGSIIFTITPSTAQVLIDKEEVDVSNPVELEYGIHQMKISEEGYDSVSKYIKVGAPSANIAVELEKAEEDTSEKDENKQDDTKQTDSKTEETSESESSKETDTNTQSAIQKEEESSKEDTNDEKDVTSSSSSYKVYIDSPEGAEVYLDGNYIGIAPVDFTKKSGNYVITLRKTGCQTRSYTLQIDSEEKDVNYSFSELVKTQ